MKKRFAGAAVAALMCAPPEALVACAAEAFRPSLSFGRRPAVSMSLGIPGSGFSALPRPRADSFVWGTSFPSALIATVGPTTIGGRSGAEKEIASAIGEAPIAQGPAAGERLRSAAQFALRMQEPEGTEAHAVSGEILQDLMTGSGAPGAEPAYVRTVSERPLDSAEQRSLRREVWRLTRQGKARRLRPDSPEYRHVDPQGVLAARRVEIYRVESGEVIDESAPADVEAYGTREDGTEHLFLFSGTLPRFMAQGERERLVEHVRLSWLEPSAAIPPTLRWKRWNWRRAAEQFGSQWRTMRRIHDGQEAFEPFLHPFEKQISTLKAVSFAAALLFPLNTWCVMGVINTAVSGARNQPPSLLWGFAAAALVCRAALIAAEWWRRRTEQLLGARVARRVRDSIAQRSPQFELGAVKDDPHDQANMIHNSAVYLTTAYVNFKTQLPAFLLQLAASAWLLYKCEPWLLLIGALAVPVSALVAANYGELHARLSQQYLARWSAMAAITGRWFAHRDVAQIFGIQKSMEADLAAAAGRVEEVSVTRARIYANYRLFVSAVASTGLVVGLVCAFRLYWYGSPLAGAIAAAQGFVSSMLAAVTGIMDAQMYAQEGEGALKALKDVLDIPIEKDDKAVIWLDPIEGKIEAEDLFFNYGSGKTPVLRGVNFSVGPGQVVAFVGPNGSGKTTLMRLVAGVLKPTSGRVLIDGHDLAIVESVSQRVQQGILPQREWNIGTVRTSLAAIDPKATEERMLGVLREAGAVFVDEKPEGLDVPMEELSGGQRQLVVTAMNILRDPPLLFIDEGMSAIDPAANAALQRVLKKDGRTVVMVTHRPETLKQADRIFFLENGRIVERGTYGELMARDEGRFRRFVEKSLEASR